MSTRVEAKHFVSQSCTGVICHVCQQGGARIPATHKLGEEIPHDDPLPMRHNLTAYVCCHCFVRVVGPYATYCPGVSNKWICRDCEVLNDRDAHFCRACRPGAVVDDNQRILTDLLSLVLARAPTFDEILRWTPEQRQQAEDWATRELISANDHDDVERLPMPAFLQRYEIPTQ